MAMRSIGVRLRMLTDQYRSDAAEAEKANKRFGDSAKKAGQDASQAMDDVALKAGIVGTALLGAAGAVIYMAAAFDKQMSEVKAVTGATADEMDALRQAALDAGAATVFSAKDAAEAEAELAKAGVKTAEILGGALRGSLDLASAGSLGLAESATIAANAMNTFGLKGKDVTHIADVLAAAANKSAVGVDDLGMGLQQVGLVADQAGFSLEETVGLLAALGDRGLRGSDGATSLKTAIQRLVAPLDEARATMKQLGIEVYDANGQVKDAALIAGQLQIALGKLGPAQRNAAMQTLFGSDAIRAANVLFDLGEQGVRDYIDAVNDQGAAGRMAGEKLNNLAGDVENLKGALETLFIESGSGATGGLRFLVDVAGTAVETFAALPGPIQTGTVAITGVTGAALLGTAAVLKLRSAMAELAVSAAAMGPVQGTIAKSGSALLVGAGKVAGVVLALSVAKAAVDAANKGGDRNIDAFADDLTRVAQGLEATGDAAFLSRDGIDGFDKALKMATLSGTGRGIESFIEKIIPGVDHANASLKKSGEYFADLDSALAQMVGSGRANEAAAIFQQIADRADEQGRSLDDVKKLLPGYTAALTAASDAALVNAERAELSQQQNYILAGSLEAAALEAKGLRHAFDVLNGTMLTQRSAMRDAEAAVDGLADALKESNNSLDITDAKGRAAQQAVDALAVAAIDAAQATYDQTGSVEEANKVYQDYIGMLRTQLLPAFGGNIDAVNTFINTLARVPEYKPILLDVKTRIDPNYWTLYGQHLVQTMAMGGIVTHAATGVLRDAHIASTSMPARYAYAEPQTGGEAFVPRHGDRDRSMQILAAAAGWYGASVVPQGSMAYGPAGGGGSVMVDVRLSGDGEVTRVLADRSRVEIAQRWGGDESAYLSRRATR